MVGILSPSHLMKDREWRHDQPVKLLCEETLPNEYFVKMPVKQKFEGQVRVRQYVWMSIIGDN